MTRLQWLMKYLDKAVALHSKSSAENLILIKVRKYNQEKRTKKYFKVKVPNAVKYLPCLRCIVVQFEVLVPLIEDFHYLLVPVHRRTLGCKIMNTLTTQSYNLYYSETILYPLEKLT